MEVITYDHKLKVGQSLNIYSLGDIHEGNCNHNSKLFQKAVDIIKEDPNGRWIGMGDYIDAILHTDKKRFNPVTISEKYKISDMKDLPMKQMENVFDVINPIQSKCIALLCGNHEESYIKHNSSDIYERFANMFASSAYGNCAPPRLGYVGFIRYNIIGGMHLIHALNHGDGVGGKTAGYPLTKVWDMASPFDYDVFWAGHIHQLIEDDRKTTGLSERGNILKRRKFVAVTGCFLDVYNEGTANYFEHKGRIEGDIGMIKLSIKLNRIRGLEVSQEKIKLG